MSYLLPHLRSGFAVDQAILAEEDRVVILRWDRVIIRVKSNGPSCLCESGSLIPHAYSLACRWGHDWDPVCMQVSCWSSIFYYRSNLSANERSKTCTTLATPCRHAMYPSPMRAMCTMFLEEYSGSYVFQIYLPWKTVPLVWRHLFWDCYNNCRWMKCWQES